jgi:Protein of unknown function (DUF3025)
MKLIANDILLRTQLSGMKWHAPWWNVWRAPGQRVAQRVLAGDSVAQALNAENPPLPCVPQQALPEGAAYEQFIFDTGQVPTRDNLHDFFNGLAWIVFPHTKRRLNALQATEIRHSGVQTTRGALRDALTLFDENAALWPLPDNTPSELLDALHHRQWQRAFSDLRAHWPPGQPVLFGHALLEKLVSPYKSITAHVFIARAAINSIAPSNLDLLTAQQLDATTLVPKPFIPLPVLGVPGWWADNENPQFYNDPQVFRLPKP